jgi:hypothetical protein
MVRFQKWKAGEGSPERNRRMILVVMIGFMIFVFSISLLVLLVETGRGD